MLLKVQVYFKIKQYNHYIQNIKSQITKKLTIIRLFIIIPKNINQTENGRHEMSKFYIFNKVG